MSEEVSTVRVHTTYEVGFSGDHDLPKGYTKDDISEFTVKYGTLQIDFKDGTSHIEELVENFDEVYDQMKSPIYCDVYELDDNGDIIDNDSDNSFSM